MKPVRSLVSKKTFQADDISSINSSPEHTNRRQRESVNYKLSLEPTIEVYDPDGDREDEFKDALKEIAKMDKLVMKRSNAHKVPKYEPVHDSAETN